MDKISVLWMRRGTWIDVL